MRIFFNAALILILLQAGTSVVAYADIKLQFREMAQGNPCQGDEALKACFAKAQQGEAASEFEVGKLYQYGRGVKQDYKKALEWYMKAAMQEEPRAQNNIGNLYDFGWGVPQDHAEAVKWYQKSADQRHAHAEYNLALHYEHGEGVPIDYRAALKWYQRAAADGQPNKDADRLKQIVTALDFAKRSGRRPIVVNLHTPLKERFEDNAGMRDGIQYSLPPSKNRISGVSKDKLPFVFRTKYNITGMDAPADRQTLYVVGEVPVKGDPASTPAAPAGAKSKPIHATKPLKDSDREGHLLVFDTHDPARPVLINDIFAGHEQPWDTCVSGKKLFIRGIVGFGIGGGENLVIFDIADAAHPVFRSIIPGSPRYYSPDGTKVIVYKDYKNHLFDITDAAHPAEIGNSEAKIDDIFNQMNNQKIERCSSGEPFNPGPEHRGVYDKLGTEVAYSEGGGFEIQDITSPDHPQVIDTVLTDQRDVYFYRLLPDHENLVFATSFTKADKIVFLASKNPALCGARGDPAADMICRNESLSLLDNDLNYLYETHLEGLSRPDEKKEIRLQRHWLKETRNACLTQAGNEEDKVSCMKQAYLDKLQQLGN